MPTRPEVVCDVISGADVNEVAVDVRVKFGDSWLNSGRIIQLFAGEKRGFRLTFYALFDTKHIRQVVFFPR